MSVGAVRACEVLIRWGLVALIAFTPLAFGTVESWAISLMEWGIVTLALVYMLQRVLDPQEIPAGRRRFTGMEIPVGLFLLYGALQMVPVPISLLKAVSPGSARMYQLPDIRQLAENEHHGTVDATVGEPLLNLKPIDRAPVSVRPTKTADQIVLLFVLAVLFWFVSRWAERGERPVFLCAAVTAVGFVVALEGMIQFLTWNGKIYWVRKVPPSSPFGPFVNHDHFAGYAEMVIPVAIGLAFYLISVRRRPPRGPEGRGALDGREWSEERPESGRLSQGGIALFAATVLVVTLFMSLSRGGILSALVSALVLFGLLARRIPSRKLFWTIGLGMPVLVVVLIGWIGADAVAKQVGTLRSLRSESSFQTRAIIWRRVLVGLPDFVWVGSGLGTFEESFAAYAPAGSIQRWSKAHNDYLQLLWETGLVGAAIVLWGGFVFVRRYWWTALRGRGHPLDLFRLGIAVSMLSIALHSLVDFSLQIGANGFLFALLGGLLVALDRRVASDVRERSPSVTPIGRASALGIAAPPQAPYIE